jgi:hypothetical protein
MDLQLRSALLLEPVAAATGLEPTMVRYVACLFLSVPLGFVQDAVGGGAMFSAVVGPALFYYNWGMDVQWIALPAAACYLLMLLLPRKHVGSGCFVFALGYLIGWCASPGPRVALEGGSDPPPRPRSHILSASGDAWLRGEIDWTGKPCSPRVGLPAQTRRRAGTLMVVTAKLIAIGFNYQDGGVKDPTARPAHRLHHLSRRPPPKRDSALL